MWLPNAVYKLAGSVRKSPESEETRSGRKMTRQAKSRKVRAFKALHHIFRLSRDDSDSDSDNDVEKSRASRRGDTGKERTDSDTDDDAKSSNKMESDPMTQERAYSETSSSSFYSCRNGRIGFYRILLLFSFILNILVVAAMCSFMMVGSMKPKQCRGEKYEAQAHRMTPPLQNTTQISPSSTESETIRPSSDAFFSCMPCELMKHSNTTDMQIDLGKTVCCKALNTGIYKVRLIFKRKFSWNSESSSEPTNTYYSLAKTWYSLGVCSSVMVLSSCEAREASEDHKTINSCRWRDSILRLVGRRVNITIAPWIQTDD